MFGKLKELVAGGASKLTGKTDLLEAIAAGGILVSAADGEIEAEEVGVLIESLVGHEVLGASFTETQINQVVDRMIKKASPNAAGKIGMVGKLALEKEVREVKAKSSSEDIVLMLAILTDIASSDDDGIEPAEKAMINKISNSLGQGNFL